MVFPSGMGIYGRSRYLDKKWAIFLRDHQITWYVPISLSKLAEQVTTGKKYGIEVHGGMIPLPNSTQASALAALDKITTAVRIAGAASRHLDTEEGVFWKEQFCKTFVNIAAGGSQIPFGVTCYGSHKGKLAGLQFADYYLDQVYDKGKIETKDQNAMFNKSLERFYAISGQALVGIGVGAFLNYKNPDGTKTVTVKPLDRFQRHLDGFPRPMPFVGVWSLPSFQATPEKFRAHWDAIAETKLDL